MSVLLVPVLPKFLSVKFVGVSALSPSSYNIFVVLKFLMSVLLVPVLRNNLLVTILGENALSASSYNIKLVIIFL
jgi:hypothetical protein